MLPAWLNQCLAGFDLQLLRRLFKRFLFQISLLQR